MEDHNATKINSIRHMVEHADRPLHPYLVYCEFLLGRIEDQRSQAEIRETQTRTEKVLMQVEIDRALDLVDAARRVCDYFRKPGVIYRTREECDLIDWLHSCVATCEA